MATAGMAMTVAGDSTSSTRQLTVGMTKAVDLWGTPWKPSSRNGISNSRLSSLQAQYGVVMYTNADGKT